MMLKFICFILMSFLLFSHSLLGIASENIVSPYNYIVQLAQLGIRVPGTLGHQKAVFLMHQFLKNQKINTQLFNFRTKTPLGIKSMVNILATVKPMNEIKKTIVLATHYDSKYFSQFFFLGVDDGLSGTGLLLTLAQYFQKHPLKNIALHFLFLDGEEAFQKWSHSDSLYGSRYQIQIWKKDDYLSEINYFILFDMIGGHHLHFCVEQLSQPDLVKEYFQTGIDLGFENVFDLTCRIQVEDDHLPFVINKVPVLELIPSPFPSYWHTFKDNLSVIDPDSLNMMYKITKAFLTNKDQSLSV